MMAEPGSSIVSRSSTPARFRCCANTPCPHSVTGSTGSPAFQGRASQGSARPCGTAKGVAAGRLAISIDVMATPAQQRHLVHLGNAQPELPGRRLWHLAQRLEVDVEWVAGVVMHALTDRGCGFRTQAPRCVQADVQAGQL